MDFNFQRLNLLIVPVNMWAPLRGSSTISASHPFVHSSIRIYLLSDFWNFSETFLLRPAIVLSLIRTARTLTKKETAQWRNLFTAHSFQLSLFRREGWAEAGRNNKNARARPRQARNASVNICVKFYHHRCTEQLPRTQTPILCSTDVAVQD